MPPLPADNEQKTFRGKRLAIPAAAWNKVIDATKAYTRAKGREGPAGADTDTLLPADTILVKNTLSTDLTTSFQVLGVGDPVLTADADPVNLSERLTLTGTYPAASSPFAVLQEPCAQNEYARAAVGGYTLCYVKMNDPLHEWADALGTDSTQLASQADPGPARIVWHGAGGTPPAGAELAVVHITGAGASSAASVISWKDVVRVATTTAATLSSAFENGDTVDGVVLATGDRILIKNQSSPADDGIYTVNATGSPTRATDADGVDEMVGLVVWVSEGTANRNTIWACVTDKTITPGTTSTVWVQVTPEICEVTVTDTGSGHTVKKKTVSAGAMADVSGPVLFSPCWSATGSALAVGTKVAMYRIPDVQSAANYWIFPTSFDLTVEEDDGSPSYTGINDVQVEHTFLTLTQPSAGKALVTFAMPHGEGSGYATYTVSGGSVLTWTNVLMVGGSSSPLVIPGHGWYDLELTFEAHFDMQSPSFSGGSDIGQIDVRWRNDTDAVDYADDFAASSRITSADLAPAQDTVWYFRVTIPTRVHVTQGSDTNKNFLVQASVSCTPGGTCEIISLRTYWKKISN